MLKAGSKVVYRVVIGHSAASGWTRPFSADCSALLMIPQRQALLFDVIGYPGARCGQLRLEIDRRRKRVEWDDEDGFEEFHCRRGSWNSSQLRSRN